LQEIKLKTNAVFQTAHSTFLKVFPFHGEHLSTLYLLYHHGKGRGAVMVLGGGGVFFSLRTLRETKARKQIAVSARPDIKAELH